MYTPPPTGGGPARGPRWPLISSLGCGGLIALLVFFWVVGTIVGPPPEEPAEPAAAGTSSAAASPASPSVPASPTRETPAAAPSTPASSPPAPPAAKPTTSRTPEPAPTRRSAPRPTAEQQHVYLARVRLIDPALAAKPERDIRRARGICDRIINPPGGTISLVDYTIYMLSGPDVQLTERQARQVIAAVRAWCR